MTSWVTNNAMSRLNTMIEAENCDLINILSDSILKVALKKQSQKLIEFFIQNIKRLTYIALGFEPTTKLEVKASALKVILSQNHSFKAAILYNQDFLECLNQFISSDEEHETHDLTSFCRIIQWIISSTNCQILEVFPEREKLFERLFKYVKYSSINDLIDFITNDGRKIIVSFLEICNVTEVLLSLISDNEYTNEKIFSSLSNIMASIEVDSPLLTPFENPNVMVSILDRALNTSTSTKCSSKIFQFMIEIIHHCQYDDEKEETNPTDPLYETVYLFIKNKIPDITQYIMNDKKFLIDKNSAVELITTILSDLNQLPPCFTDLCVYLFNSMLLYPCHSFLHHSFFMVFETAMNHINILKKIIGLASMKTRIINQFDQKDAILASYWGTLYQLAININGKLDNSEDEMWNHFYSTTIASIKEKIASSYGGPMPSDNDSNYDDLIFPLGNSQLKKVEKNIIETIKVTFDEEEDNASGNEEDEEIAY